MFVHEWAHLRWGVFDEYNSEKPFYVNGKNQIKTTRSVLFLMFKIIIFWLKNEVDNDSLHLIDKEEIHSFFSF